MVAVVCSSCVVCRVLSLVVCCLLCVEFACGLLLLVVCCLLVVAFCLLFGV